MYLPHRIKPPTPTQFTALFWTLLVILVGFGAVCLYLGYRAPPEKADEATRAIRYGYGCITAAVVIYIIRRRFYGYSC